MSNFKPDVPPVAVWQNSETTFMNDYGYRTLVVDRNYSGIDLNLLSYLAQALEAEAKAGRKAVNIVLQRVSTDELRDMREHCMQVLREEQEINAKHS